MRSTLQIAKKNRCEDNICASPLPSSHLLQKYVAKYLDCATRKRNNASMNFGYARVSTDDQATAAQLDALREAKCERMFEERASGGRWDRPELHRMLDQLRDDDVVVVWKLDRLSRSLKDLLSIMEKIEAAGAGFRSLTESIDTTTPAGRMMMQMVGVFAEFEREMIRERTRAGLERARKKGRHPGRKPKLSDDQRKEVRDMVRSGKRTEAEAARLFNVHRSTISRVMREATPDAAA